MCNAYNHTWDCDCGFGGDTGGGGGRRRLAVALAMLERPVSSGWTKDSRGTVDSYVNPNAHCPVCGAPVFFYRSPYDGRVFFDDLGWPWPKHGCTDNRREPLRTTRNSVSSSLSRRELKWQAAGWSPLLSPRIYAGDRPSITGDLEDSFRDLMLSASEQADAGSPVFLRPRSGMPGLFDVAFLRSDHFQTEHRQALAFERKIAPVGEDTIAKAVAHDPAANYAIGHFLLWDLDDPGAAVPYLGRAGTAGIFDALIDLAVLRLFSE